MKDKLVSIIIPAYNIQSYILTMIDSLAKQSYKNFEAMIIDNCSEDLTFSLVKRYCEKDHRFKCFQELKPGVSNARNKGLRNINGYYTLFVDGDDWIDPNYIERLIEAAEKNDADLVLCEYWREERDKHIQKKSKYYDCTLGREEVYLQIVNPTGLYGAVWGKLFRTSLIVENSLTFDANVDIGEDLLFTLSYLQVSHKFYYIVYTGYHYFVREGSSLNCLNPKKMQILDVYKSIFDNVAYDEIIYERAKAMYSYECANWFCRLYKKPEYKYLRSESVKYIKSFLYDSAYSVNTKWKMLFKLCAPQIAIRFM